MLLLLPVYYSNLILHTESIYNLLIYDNVSSRHVLIKHDILINLSNQEKAWANFLNIV